MSKSKDLISQGGPGTTGESSAAEAVCPMDSGRGKKSTKSIATTFLVGDQAKATGRVLVGDQASATGRNSDDARADKEKEEKAAQRELESGQVDKEGNFRRKPSTQRSPVQVPRMEEEDEEEVEEEENEVFEGDTSESNERETRAILESLGLDKSLGGAGLVIMPSTAAHKRQSTVGNSPPEGSSTVARKKPKPYARTGKQLETPLQQLKRDISNMADAIQDETIPRSRLQAMLEKIQEHVNNLEKPKKDEATQTEKGPIKVKEIADEDIAGINTYAEFWKKSQLKWNEGRFKNVKKVVANPTRSRSENLLVIVEPQDANMQIGIQKLFAERHPELLDIAGELGDIEKTTKIVVAGTVEVRDTRILKATPANLKEGLWETFSKVRDLVEELGGKELITHKLAGADEGHTRMMLQCIFANTEVQVTLCHPAVTKPTMAQIHCSKQLAEHFFVPP